MIRPARPVGTSDGVPTGAWHVLWVIFAATLVISLSSTMLTIALPSIAGDLDATAGQTSWALTAYLLTNTASLLLMGQLADAVDRRRMFLGGVAVFTVTSVGLARVDSIGALVALRGLQGLGGAMLLCNAVAVLVAVFPGRLLGRAMGVYLAGFSVAQVAGPAIGGLVTAGAGWRYLFLCSVPVGLLAFAWGWRALARVPLPRRTQVHVDVLGNTLIAVSLIALLTALTFAPDRGLADPWVAGVFVLGLGLLPALWYVEQRVAHPVLDLRLLRDRAFALPMLAGFLVASPRLSIMVAAALWFQGVEGESPLGAAGEVTVAAVGLTVGALVADLMARWWSSRRVSVGATAASVGGLLLLGWAVGHGGGPVMQVGLLIVGLGTGVFHPLNVSTVMRAAPASRAGSVNALRVTLQSTSMALASAAALATAVAWVSPAAAAAFVAGDPDGLSAGDLDGIVLGFQVLFAGFAVVVALGGLAASAVRPPQARVSGGRGRSQPRSVVPPSPQSAG